jgi:SWI/SNF-related matrix-associated actin-dependent regulator 1 of chromatin subfamily A
VIVLTTDASLGYICHCTYAEKDIPKLAGFWWEPNRKVWYTRYKPIAALLGQYANSEAAKSLLIASPGAEGLIARSKATNPSASGFSVPLPSGLELLQYQLAAIETLLELPNCLLADEMGLGKTPMALAFINAARLRNVLIVCPNSLKINWYREAKKWLVDTSLSYKVVDSKTKLDDKQSSNIYIVNYDIIHKWKDVFKNYVFDIVICDESHYLKSWGARRTKSVLKLIESIPRKLFLTGTPMLAKPMELWTTISTLSGYRNFREFRDRYCAIDGHGKNLEELQLRLRKSIMIRRLKSEVLTQLPAKTRQIIELPEDAGLLKKQNALVKKYNATSTEDLFSASQKLKGSTSSPLMFEIAELRKESAFIKLPYLFEAIKDILEEDRKVVVFAYHHEIVEAIYNQFKEQGAVLLYGPTSLADRQLAIDKFQNEPGTKVFVGSVSAAGVGITLTASSVCIFCELDWTPAVLTQCEDRLHRIGQKDSVLVQHYVLENSFDANMVKLLVRKQQDFDKCLGSSNQEVSINNSSSEWKDEAYANI